MNGMLANLMDQQVLVLALVGMVGALALQWLKPTMRRELKFTWWLLLLGSLGQLGAVIAQWQGMASVAGLVAGGATVVMVLGIIQLLVLWLFHGLLPAFGMLAPRIAQDLTVTGLSLAWGMVWLRLSGVDATQLFTTSAIITAVLAFALQDTLGNVLGGVALQLDNSLKVGEWVRIDDISGRVVDVRWRYTAIETRNRETFVVPNSWLMKNRFGVLRHWQEDSLIWRRSLNFNIDPAADPAAVIETLQHAVLDARMEHVAATPAASAVLLDTASGYYRYALRYWLTDPLYDDATDSVVRVHALAALTRAGIGLGLSKEERLIIKENEGWHLANEKRESKRRLDAVQRTALFATLPQEEQALLATHLVHAPFVKGDVLTHQGAVAHWLYLIVQGQAQVVVDEAGMVTPIAVLSDGDFFGEMGMLTGEPRSATVLALTDVNCYRLDKVGFAQVLAARPGMANDISSVLALRRHDLDVRIKMAKDHQAPVPPEDLLARIKAFFGAGGGA